MSYIGQRPVVGRYIKLDQISSGFNGSNTGFSMTAGSQAVFPGTARNLLLSLGGVIQEPDTDFTISGSTLTFTTPPVANTTFFGVIYGDMQATGTPSDGTVLPASIASSGNFSFPEVTVTGSATIGTDLIHAGDTDTKLSFGTNEITLNTAGSERLELDIDETTFNEGGSDTDFRIRTPAQTHMFFLDAGNNQIGIKTSSLQSGAVLTVNGRTHLGTQLTLGSNSTLDAGAQATIYKPATNTLAFATAGANERMRIDSSGNVGIGTSAPSTRLEVKQDNGVAYNDRVQTASYNAARFFNSSGHTGAGAFTGMQFGITGDSQNRICSIGMITEASNNRKSSLVFATDDDGNRTEKLRITGDGNVGIGTTSPDTLLHAKVNTFSDDINKVALTLSNNQSSGVHQYFQNTSTGTGVSNGARIGLGNTDNFLIQHFEAKDIQISTNGTERMRIDSSGNVGIGTTSPSTKFEVRDGTGTGISSRSTSTQATDTNKGLKVRNNSDTDTFSVSYKGLGYFAGRVGIGTTSPDKLLHLAGANTAIIRLENTDTTLGTDQIIGGIEFEKQDATGAGVGIAGAIRLKSMSSVGQAASMFFSTSNSSGNDQTRMTVDFDGNVGIGTTSPTKLLTLNHATNPSIRFEDDGTKVVEINSEGSSTNIASFEGKALVFATSTSSSFSERMRIDTSGRFMVGVTSSVVPFQVVAGASGFGGENTTGVFSDTTFPTTGVGGGVTFSGRYNSGSSQVGFAAVRGRKENSTVDGSDYAGALTFATRPNGGNMTERMRIDSSGNVVPADSLNVLSTLRTQGQTFVKLTGHSTSNFSVMVFGVNSGGHNTGSCAVALGKHDTNNRSLNAAGTVNASGNDYAEYMTKSSDFTLAKGDICGIDANGKLTNKFSESISFVVKSTDPSYVGGDAWGTQEVLGEKPADDSDDLPAYEEKYEAARKMVDRIAFSGQVPVNVTGTTPGQHIIPTLGTDDSITGVAKAEASLSMAEYISSVGKVIALESDGRARIIVKVA